MAAAPMSGAGLVAAAAPAPVPSIIASSAPSTADAMERQILLERAKKKDPVFAAVAGFILPFAGAFYTGRWGIGIFFLILEPLADFLGAPITFGSLPLIYRGIAAFLCFKWAKAVNLVAMEELWKKQR
jgi:hypothetical protein